MLLLRQLTLLQFKNYKNRSFSFHERVIGFCGNNGAGKTNLLDAIYYLCFTKSYLTRQEGANVQRGAAGFRLEGDFLLHDKPEKTTCILRENGKKEFSVNDEPYD
ncbi:MAG: AAA family ATPase, partial [Chitinophagaceae bacterium]|nr:AAA family ATPase [Chitinophagaceae bacterium]